MTTNLTIFETDNRQRLSELYFKAISEKDAIKRVLLGSDYPTEQYLNEYTQLNRLVDDLRCILGTVVLTVP